MPITTSAKRKTRQQKIVASQRRSAVEPVAASVISESPVMIPAHNEYRYVLQDLHHIAWITVVSLMLLMVATVLLSDFSWFVSLRSALHLPTLNL